MQSGRFINGLAYFFIMFWAHGLLSDALAQASIPATKDPSGQWCGPQGCAPNAQACIDQFCQTVSDPAAPDRRYCAIPSNPGQDCPQPSTDYVAGWPGEARRVACWKQGIGWIRSFNEQCVFQGQNECLNLDFPTLHDSNNDGVAETCLIRELSCNEYYDHRLRQIVNLQSNPSSNWGGNLNTLEYSEYAETKDRPECVEVLTHNPKACSAGAGAEGVGNPIGCSTGQKRQTENYYTTQGPESIRISRTFQSDVKLAQKFASPWSFSHSVSYSVIKEAPTFVIVRVTFGANYAQNAETGAYEKLSAKSILFLGDPATGTLSSSHTQYGTFDFANKAYITATGKRYDFDTNGYVTKRTAANGSELTHTWDTNTQGQVTETIANAFGKTVIINYSDWPTNGGYPLSFITPAGEQYTYGYDAEKRLVSVTYPDSTPNDSTDNPKRQYVYEDERFPKNLTGIIDENGSRYATWNYNELGQAISSEHGEGIEKVELVYESLSHLLGQMNVEHDGTKASFDPAIFSGTTMVRTHLDANTIRDERYHYERVGGQDLITQIERLSDGKSKTWDYDGYGNLTSTTDYNGVTTQYKRDNEGFVTEIREALATSEERVTTITWNKTHNKVASVLQGYLQTTYAYNSEGNITSVNLRDTQSGATRTTKYQYNTSQLVSQIDGPRTDINDITTFVYQNDELITVTNALGQVTTLNDYTADGRVQQVTDANGVVTRLRYHPRGWLTEIERAGAITRYEYDKVGQVIRVTQANGVMLSFEYDAGHRLTAVVDGQGNRQELTYNALGNVVESTLKDPNGLLKYSQSQVFDELGRLNEQLGNNGQRTTHQFDPNGNPIETIDGEGHRSTNSFDNLNRLRETLDPLQGKTAIDYDSANRPVKVTDAEGRQTVYIYNDFGDLLKQISPDTGATSYQYDEAGNVTAQTDARGVTVRYSYDALNRLTFIDYPDDNLDTTFTYDQGDFGIGRLTATSNAYTSQRFTYNALGFTTGIEQVIDGQVYTTTYAYDDAGLMTGITYPSGKTVQYTLNNLGQSEAVTWDSLTVADDIDYLPFGPVSHLEFGNGIALDNTYDNDYRLIHRSDQHTQQINYGYTLRNNIISIVDELNGRSPSFEYDALERLTQTVGGEAFRYDAIGNRLTENSSTDQSEANQTDNNLPFCEPVSPNATDAQMLASWLFAGDLAVQDSNALTGSPVGNVTFKSASEAGRDAISLDGQSAVIMPASEAFNLDSFTLSAWIKTNNAGSGYSGIAIKHFAFGLFLYNNQLATYDWSRYTRHDSGVALNDGQWHHVMLTRDADSGRFAMYADGFKVADGNYGIAHHNYPLVLGAGDSTGSSQRFLGEIAEVRLFDQALTPTELEAKLNPSSNDESTEEVPEACRPADASALNDWRLGGQKPESAGATFHGGYQLDVDAETGRTYLNLDGQSGSYLNLGNGATVQSEAFTLGAWIRTDNAGSGYRGIALKHFAYGLFLYNNRLATYDWSSYTPHYNGVTLNDGQWHFVTMTREAGARAPVKLYVDGELVLVAQHGIAHQEAPLVIGAGNANGSNQNFAGDIAQVTLLDHAASSTEIVSMMSDAITQPGASSEIKDAHGNILSDGSNNYEYNDAGRLAKATNKDGLITEYFYNASQQRIKKVNENEIVHYVYDLAGQLIGEYDQNGNAVIEYLYLNGQRVGIVKNGELYYTHTNHLDAPTAITNSEGTIVWEAHYDAFGNITVTHDTIGGLNARLPGQYEDNETGLFYNLNRYYDPKQGRYITSDPLGLYDGPNTYSYVQNNPLNLFDPSGLSSVSRLAGGIRGGVAGGSVGSSGSVVIGAGGSIIVDGREVGTVGSTSSSASDCKCEAGYTNIYRVVGADEYASIRALNAYSIAGNTSGFSQKQFWLSYSDAEWFAAQEVKWQPERGKIQRHIVTSRVCKSTLQGGYPFTDVGHPAISFGEEQLPAVNRDARQTGGINELQILPPTPPGF